MVFKIYRYFMTDSLYRNSIYLMLSTAVMAFFGFFFWILNARLFTSDQIGLATTMISIATFISSFSLLGLNVGLIHYLPTSERKNEKINTSFTLVLITAVLFAIGYLIGLSYFSPRLLFIRENLIYLLVFIALIAGICLNNIIDTVFIAYRSSVYVLIKNTVLSIFKLILPIVFVTFGSFGIFIAFGLSAVLGFLLGLGFLLYAFDYMPQPSIHTAVVSKMMKFSFNNYIAGFIGLLPINILPIIITNNISASTSAYFYICMMIANLLYIIPIATSQSLLAEGSYSKEELKTHVRKAIGIIFLILIPTIIVTLFFGNILLAVFGKQYADQGFPFLRLIALGTIGFSITQVGYVLINIEHKPHINILINMFGVIITFVACFLFISYKLTGIGLAVIIGQAATALIYIVLLRKFLW